MTFWGDFLNGPKHIEYCHMPMDFVIAHYLLEKMKFDMTVVRFNRLLNHPSIKLSANEIKTAHDRPIICQTQYFNREYAGRKRSNLHTFTILMITSYLPKYTYLHLPKFLPGILTNTTITSSKINFRSYLTKSSDPFRG